MMKPPLDSTLAFFSYIVLAQWMKKRRLLTLPARQALPNLKCGEGPIENGNDGSAPKENGCQH
jgi:hypothetical protein